MLGRPAPLRVIKSALRNAIFGCKIPHGQVVLTRARREWVYRKGWPKTFAYADCFFLYIGLQVVRAWSGSLVSIIFPGRVAEGATYSLVHGIVWYIGCWTRLLLRDFIFISTSPAKSLATAALKLSREIVRAWPWLCVTIANTRFSMMVTVLGSLH